MRRTAGFCVTVSRLTGLLYWSIPAVKNCWCLHDCSVYPFTVHPGIAPGLWRHPVCKIWQLFRAALLVLSLHPLPGCCCFIFKPGGCFKFIRDENLAPLKSLAKLPLTSEEPGFHPKTLCRLLVNGKHTSGFSRVIIVGGDLCSGKHWARLGWDRWLKLSLPLPLLPHRGFALQLIILDAAYQGIPSHRLPVEFNACLPTFPFPHCRADQQIGDRMAD